MYQQGCMCRAKVTLIDEAKCISEAARIGKVASFGQAKHIISEANSKESSGAANPLDSEAEPTYKARPEVTRAIWF